jgi:CubicO group peptidase (beta-lactamase class C family)
MLLVVSCDPARSIKGAVSDMDRMFAGSVLIARDGVVYLSKGYGQADLEKNLPCTPQTKYRLASITKQFTAMAILLLEARGALRVQDAIGNYVSPCPAAWKGITIRHLLTHTSGIPDPANPPSTVDKAIALLRGRSLDFAPGSKWQYSNSRYILLGAIIEKVPGVPYEEFVRTQICIPLGMSSTGYDHGGQDLAVNDKSPGMKADISAVPSFFSAGALYSTVEDLYIAGTRPFRLMS